MVRKGKKGSTAVRTIISLKTKREKRKPFDRRNKKCTETSNNLTKGKKGEQLRPSSSLSESRGRKWKLSQTLSWDEREKRTARKYTKCDTWNVMERQQRNVA